MAVEERCVVCGAKIWRKGGPPLPNGTAASRRYYMCMDCAYENATKVWDDIEIRNAPTLNYFPEMRKLLDDKKADVEYEARIQRIFAERLK